MADDILSLGDIKVRIAPGQPFTLDERTLGQNCFAFLRRTFAQQAKFVLQKCGIPEVAENYLSCTGTFERLFPWENVDVTITLIDHPPARTGKKRHCLLRMPVPSGSVNKYLSQYYSGLDIPRTFADIAIIRNLDDYVRAMSFADTGLVFSSIDYSSALSANIYYPDALKSVIQASEVKAGINFLVTATFDEVLESYCGELLESGPLKTDKGQGVICPGEFGPMFSVRKTMTVDHRIDPFGLEFRGLGMVFPLTPDAVTGAQMFFDGAVSIGSQKLSCRADFNPYDEKLSLSFYRFPSLKQVLDLVRNGDHDTSFGEPFTSLLTVELSRLGIVLGLRDKSVSEVSLSVIGEKEVILIEKIISFKPALEMRIAAPFDSEFRTIEGELTGTWKLGDTTFETALYYPSFDFSAGMAEGQTLDPDAVVKQILSGIDLGARPLVTKMELNGNFLRKSFSAEISVDEKSKCAFSIAGRSFDFHIKNMLMAYDNQRVSYAMDGSLLLAGVQVLLLAQYETDQGWMLSGSTVVDETINLSRIVHDLLEAIALPTSLPDLELTDIVFSAAPKEGTYSLSGRTAKKAWQLTDRLSLTVERFAVEKRQGLSATGLLRITLTVGEKVVRLSAEKAAAAAGGWKFQGSTAEGQKIKIAEIVKWVGKQFGDTPQLPEAIEGFTVNNLKLSFESESQDFFFTCAGEVTFPGQNTAVKGIVTIDIKHQGESNYTKLFGGSLTIDGIEFDLIFESSKTADGDSNLFVAAYHDPNGHPIKIDEVINRFIDGSSVKTGLDITLKDALFAFRKTDKEAKFLFGLDIEGGLNLSELNLPNLPLIGQPFAAGQTLKLALQVLATGKSTFAVEEIKTLNRLNGKGINLPEQEVTGVKLAAVLRVGEEIKPLSLPIGLSSKGDGLEQKPLDPETRTDQPSSSVRSTDDTQWIKIQKTFGPIHVERVGIGFKNGKLGLLLDAALTAAGLTLSLDGLGAEFSLKDLAAKSFKPTFHLNGLGIDYRSGPLEIGGSFLEQKGKLTPEDTDYTSYAGLAVIRTAKLTLSAIGSYTQLNDRDPSLFIYAVANYALGGPAFFYVTGFAAGFGYNRALILPPIENLASFPLIAEAVKDGGPAKLPSGQKEQQETLTNKLAQLEKYLPPSLGDIFIAAGIKFTSFKQIDSFALLVVKFGRRFEIDLLGLSTLTAPPPEAGKAVAPIAEAQLALKATFIPDEGFLGVRAQLTSNSYILSKDCHLNGGFAFYTWFAPHRQAGDFVLTLGGYHPKFIAPDHYPQVPRLSLNWQVNSELHLKADAYFALTGSAIMAGAHLQATWQSGALRAWFNAGADFILAWKPYSYEAEVYIGMGVSYTFEAFGNQTLSVDLGANLHLWGPPFSGTATIHWSIISFTVNFGQGAPQRLEKLDWKTFQNSFLPNSAEICSVMVQQGLVRQMKAEGKQAERWIVNPKEMVLAINSTVPLSKLKPLASHLRLEGSNLEEEALAIAPMGIASKLESTCSIEISGDDGQKLEKDTFEVRPVRKSMAAALWGKPNLSENKEYLRPPNLNAAQLVEKMLTGFEIRPVKRNQQPHSCSINRDELQYTIEAPLEACGWQDFSLSELPGEPAWNKAAQTAAVVRKERARLMIEALGMVNAVIDFGEPVDQGVLLAA